MAQSRRRSFTLSVCCLLLASGLAAAAYGFGVGSDAGRDVDAYLLQHGNDALVELLGDTFVLLVNPVTAVIAVLVMVRHADRAGRRGDGIRAALIVGTAAAASAVAKRLLGDHDPLGHEAARALGRGFFPSGHATVTMALCLAALLTFAPRARGLLLVVGIFGSVLGFSVAAGRSHHLSDVFGGFLLAGAVAALCLLGRWAPRADDGASRLSAPDVLRGIGLVVGAIVLLESPRYLFAPEHLPGEAATAIAVSALAFTVVGSFAWLVAGTEHGEVG